MSLVRCEKGLGKCLLCQHARGSPRRRTFAGLAVGLRGCVIRQMSECPHLNAICGSALVGHTMLPLFVSNLYSEPLLDAQTGLLNCFSTETPCSIGSQHLLSASSVKLNSSPRRTPSGLLSAITKIAPAIHSAFVLILVCHLLYSTSRSGDKDYVACEFTAEDEAKWKDDNSTFIRSRKAALNELQAAENQGVVKKALTNVAKSQDLVQLQAAINTIPDNTAHLPRSPHR
jgi:hypothetical protein